MSKKSMTRDEEVKVLVRRELSTVSKLMGMSDDLVEGLVDIMPAIKQALANIPMKERS